MLNYNLLYIMLIMRFYIIYNGSLNCVCFSIKNYILMGLLYKIYT